MLALELAIAAEHLEEGNQPGFQGLVGPSRKLTVAFSALDGRRRSFCRAAYASRWKVHGGLAGGLRQRCAPISASGDNKDELEPANGFDILEAYLVPLPSDLVSKTLAWTETGEESDTRMQFYSADGVPVTSPSNPKRQARRRGLGSGIADTISQLSESLEVMTESLPGITNQLQNFAQRTEQIERGQGSTSRPSALRAPLGPSATVGLTIRSSEFDTSAQKYIRPTSSAPCELLSDGGGRICWRWIKRVPVLFKP